MKINRRRIENTVRDTLDSIQGNRVLDFERRRIRKRRSRNCLCLWMAREKYSHKKNKFIRKLRSCVKFVPRTTNNGRKKIIWQNRRNLWLLSYNNRGGTVINLYSDGTLRYSFNQGHDPRAMRTNGLVKVRYLYRIGDSINRTSLW